MARQLFSLNGYDVIQANFQPSKKGEQRSIQIRKNSTIKKNIRYSTNEVDGLEKAKKKAREWINQQQPMKFDFWKNNRIDQHHQKTLEELKQLLSEWLSKKERAWLEYYNSDRIIRAFIATDEDGLLSTLEQSQYNSYAEELSRIVVDYLYPKKIENIQIE